MLDTKIYTKAEIKSMMKNVNKMYYIGGEEYKKEKFEQIKILNKFIPYIISSYGRIFSINYAGRKHNIKQLKTNINNNGYERITITYQDLSVTLSIHRLVAISFIFNDDIINKIEVNHIDGNKLNNNAENLEWVSPEENIRHAFCKGIRKRGENNPRSKYTNKQIIEVCKMIVKDYPLKDISLNTDVHIDTVKDILKRKTWTHISCDYDFSKYHYGINDKEYKAYISNLHKVCIMLEENFSFKYIKEVTHFTDNQISHILNRRTNLNISQYYDFSNYNYGKPYNYEDILRQICMYAEKGEYTMREISIMTNTSYKVVQHLLYGETYKNISKDYNLEKYRKKIIRFNDYPFMGVHCKLLTVEIPYVLFSKDDDIVCAHDRKAEEYYCSIYK